MRGSLLVLGVASLVPVGLEGWVATDALAAGAAGAEGAGTSAVPLTLHAAFPALLADIVDIARGAPAAFFALSVACILAFAPGSAFTLVAGLAYGLWLGLAISVAATAVAAIIHFALARYFLRGRVQRRWGDGHRFEALDRAVAREGWKIVGLTRASALIPGAVQSCLYGLTSVPFRTFFWASVVGLIPSTMAVAAAGSTGGDLLALGGAPGAGASLPGVGLRVAPILLLVVGLGYLARAARRELARPGGARAGTTPPAP